MSGKGGSGLASAATSHKRDVKDNITLVLMGVVVLCVIWEIANFTKAPQHTFSEVFRRLNFQSGGLIFWFLLAFMLHATIAWPTEFHNRDDYIRKWGTTPDVET